MAALFSVASFVLQNNGTARRTGVEILAGACIAVLGLIWFIVWRAQRAVRVSSDTRETPPVRHPRSKIRTLAVVAALGFIELTQLSRIPYAVRALCVAMATALFAWAFISSYRSRRD